MKTLTNYTEEAINQALKNAGAFFAFSDDQYNKQKKQNTKYSHLGAGLICPTDKVKQFKTEYDNALQIGIKQDIEENGLQNIIKRELLNHEAYYTGDIEDTVNALSIYEDITEAQIIQVFNEQRQNHKYF